jgi:hypothetical protein
MKNPVPISGTGFFFDDMLTKTLDVNSDFEIFCIYLS